MISAGDTAHQNSISGFLTQRSWKTLDLCGVDKFLGSQDYGTVSLGE